MKSSMTLVLITQFCVFYDEDKFSKVVAGDEYSSRPPHEGL